MKRILTTLSQKWPEYLLEILVLIIGIYGAFALDNWNENRLERKEEVKILKSVKQDLENIIREFEYLNEIRTSVLFGTKGILHYSTLDELPKKQLDSLLGLTFQIPTFNNKMGAIQLLFTSGKINFISNDSIKEKLIALPGLIDDMTEEEIYAADLFNGPYYETVVQYINLNELIYKGYTTSFVGRKGKEESFPNPPIKSDYEGLLKNWGFLNHLRMRGLNTEINNRETLKLIELANQTIEMIDAEVTL